MKSHFAYATIVAVIFFCMPASAIAFAQSQMAFPHAVTPVFRWAEPLDMQVSGIPVVVRSFVATSTLEQAAQIMALHRRHFQRVTTLPGSILLSGVHDDRHWVAQLEAGPGVVRGMVSALPLDLRPLRSGRGRHEMAPWLTQNAGLIFSHTSLVSGRKITQSLYRPHQPVADFVHALGEQLEQAGWQRDGPASWVSGAVHARRSGGSMDVLPVQAVVQGQGGVVLISLSD